MLRKRCSSTSIEAIDQSVKSRATTALNLKRRKSECRGSFSITLKSELTLAAEPSSTWRNQPECEIKTPVIPRVGLLRRQVTINLSYSASCVSDCLCFLMRTYSSAKHPTTNCRVKRHLITTTSRQHGSPAETKPDSAIPTHHPNTTEAKATQGQKLYSKVLAIEPNRLLSKCRRLNKGACLRLCFFIEAPASGCGGSRQRSG